MQKKKTKSFIMVESSCWNRSCFVRAIFWSLDQTIFIKTHSDEQLNTCRIIFDLEAPGKIWTKLEGNYRDLLLWESQESELNYGKPKNVSNRIFIKVMYYR